MDKVYKMYGRTICVSKFFYISLCALKRRSPLIVIDNRWYGKKWNCRWNVGLTNGAKLVLSVWQLHGWLSCVKSIVYVAVQAVYSIRHALTVDRRTDLSLTGSHKTSRFSQAIVESLCRRCSSRCSQLAGDDVWDNCCCCCCCCLVFDDRSAAGTERWSLIWQTMPTNKSSTRWLSTAETLMNLHARRLHNSLASVSATTTDSNKQSPCTMHS